MEIHQPATPAEKDLVDQMVAARWRVLRLQSIESGLLDSEMRQKKKLELEFPSGCSVYAFGCLPGTGERLHRDGSCLALRIPLPPYGPQLVQSPPRVAGSPCQAIHPTRRSRSHSARAAPGSTEPARHHSQSRRKNIWQRTQRRVCF